VLPFHITEVSALYCIIPERQKKSVSIFLPDFVLYTHLKKNKKDIEHFSPGRAYKN
jgi:hypothetical protein